MHGHKILPKQLASAVILSFIATIIVAQELDSTQNGTSSSTEQGNEINLSEISNELELIEEEDITDHAIQPETVIQIEQISLSIDEQNYENPNINSKAEKGDTSPTLAMRELLFRKGDQMKFSELTHKIHLSEIGLDKSEFFYSGNKIDYVVIDDSNEIVSLKLFITVKQGFRYFFSGGNAYAAFGIKYPNGLITRYYAGANRLEADLEYKNLNLASDENNISSLFLDLGVNNFLYWITPYLDSHHTQNNLMFGLFPYLAFRNSPLIKYSMGLALTGLEEVELGNSYDDTYPESSLPRSGESGVYTTDIRTAIEIHRVYITTTMFESYIESKTQYIIGTNLGEVNSNATGIYDLLASKLDVQIAGSWLLEEALRLRLAYMGAYINDDNPYVAQVNTRTRFYESYASGINWIQRNSIYSDSSPYQQQALAAKLEARFGIPSKLVSYEVLLSYEASTVISAEDIRSNSQSWFSDNMRFAFVPALLLHFASPVNIILRVDLPIIGAIVQGIEKPPSYLGISVVSTKY